MSQIPNPCAGLCAGKLKDNWEGRGAPPGVRERRHVVAASSSPVWIESFRSVVLLAAVVVAGLWGCVPRPGAPPSENTSRAVVVAAPSATPVPAKGRLIAWEAVMGDSTFTFVGSVHVASSALYPLDERLESAFRQSDTLVLELDTSAVKPAELSALLQRFATLPPGQELFASLRSTTSSSLKAALRTLEIDARSVQRMRPWYVATVLSNRVMLDAGFEPQWGIDEHFRVLAVQSKRRIVALESLEAQLSLLAGLDSAGEEELLVSTLSELGGTRDLLREALQLWKEGQAQRLYDLMLAPMRNDFPELFEAVFIRRNRAMVRRLRELSAEGRRFFVVVGAGHLLGPQGMVDILQREGGIVRPLRASH